ncbi:DUF1266 domain-containing protein [Methanolapillus millepedarum]|uniref:DUF1266 domain-containing protein n=1 Tax=Methanolapillus millepedarum TaxID=3028296 RepID=A0AA96V4Z3_9EURY|nr:hypothetical protein MsAc7_15920 [Methanosarcinaceae archaeon Ac7]
MIDISETCQKLKDVFERMFQNLETNHTNILIHEIEIFACYEEGFINILIKNGGYISQKYCSQKPLESDSNALWEEYFKENADNDTVFLASELFPSWVFDISKGPSFSKEDFFKFIKPLVATALKTAGFEKLNLPMLMKPMTFVLKVFGYPESVIYFRNADGKEMWADGVDGQNIDRYSDNDISGKSATFAVQKIEARLDYWSVLPDKNPKSELLFCEDLTLREAQYWALTAAAHISLREGQCLDSLRLNMSREEAQTHLSEKWQINSRAELVQTLDYFWYEGQHLNYDIVLENILPLSWHEWKMEIEKFTQENEDGDTIVTLIPQLESMETAFHLLKREQIIATELVTSVLAWDLSCFIYVCRLGFAAGYIGEEEAWDSIMPAAAVLQQEFESWDELSVSYLTGCLLWNNSFRERTTAVKNHELLIQDPQSPFNSLPWNLELD